MGGFSVRQTARHTCSDSATRLMHLMTAAERESLASQESTAAVWPPLRSKESSACTRSAVTSTLTLSCCPSPISRTFQIYTTTTTRVVALETRREQPKSALYLRLKRRKVFKIVKRGGPFRLFDSSLLQYMKK